MEQSGRRSVSMGQTTRLERIDAGIRQVLSAWVIAAFASLGHGDQINY